MKFSEMPYQRPNLDEIKAQFAAVTQRFAAAPDYAAAKAAFLDEQTLNKHVDTLANLASIRNTIDTRDEFYDGEMNFWNAATPQIQECQNTWSAALLASSMASLTPSTTSAVSSPRMPSIASGSLSILICCCDIAIPPVRPSAFQRQVCYQQAAGVRCLRDLRDLIELVVYLAELCGRQRLRP